MSKIDRPPSLPNNWPHPSVEDLAERPKRLVKVGTDQVSVKATFGFAGNTNGKAVADTTITQIRYF